MSRLDGIVERLEAHAAEQGIRRLLVGRGGFTADLRRKARRRNDVQLADLHRLYTGNRSSRSGAVRIVSSTVVAVKTMITDEMRAIVGVVMHSETSYPVAASDIRRWSLAVYHPDIPPPEFWDEDHPSTIANGGIVAPDEFNPLAWLTRDPKPDALTAADPPRVGAFEAALGVAPPPFRAVLQGEIRASYGDAPVRPGDVIRSETSITEYWEREGKMGLQLYTTVAEALTNQRGEWVKTVATVFVRY